MKLGAWLKLPDESNNLFMPSSWYAIELIVSISCYKQYQKLLVLSAQTNPIFPPFKNRTSFYYFACFRICIQLWYEGQRRRRTRTDCLCSIFSCPVIIPELHPCATISATVPIGLIRICMKTERFAFLCWEPGAGREQKSGRSIQISYKLLYPFKVLSKIVA